MLGRTINAHNNNSSTSTRDYSSIMYEQDAGFCDIYRSTSCDVYKEIIQRKTGLKVISKRYLFLSDIIEIISEKCDIKPTVDLENELPHGNDYDEHIDFLEDWVKNLLGDSGVSRGLRSKSIYFYGLIDQDKSPIQTPRLCVGTSKDCEENICIYICASQDDNNSWTTVNGYFLVEDEDMKRDPEKRTWKDVYKPRFPLDYAYGTSSSWCYVDGGWFLRRTD